MRPSCIRSTKSPLPPRSFRTALVWTIVATVLPLSWLTVGLDATAGEGPLTYYSDYFSFVGADQKGRVAFALDTNRGQDGHEFQAEHFVVLHDEHLGWQDIPGSGSFPNPNGELETIPNSALFQFKGTPRNGIAIKGPVDGLLLRVQPIAAHISQDERDRTRRLGSAPAILQWRNRTLRGRVIYEYLHYDNWNRLTRTYWRFWRDFQGFYLAVGGSITEKSGDFYLRSQAAANRSNRRVVEGFAVLNGKAIRLKDARLVVQKSEMALGFYRWPHRWTGRWPAEGTTSGEGHDEIRFRLGQIDRDSVANWVIGGFAMSILKGQLTHEGNTVPIYGLGEFIK